MKRYRVYFGDKNSDETRSLVVGAKSVIEAEDFARIEAEERGWPASFTVLDAVIAGEYPDSKIIATLDKLTGYMIRNGLIVAEENNDSESKQLYTESVYCLSELYMQMINGTPEPS